MSSKIKTVIIYLTFAKDRIQKSSKTVILEQIVFLFLCPFIVIFRLFVGENFRKINKNIQIY